MIKLYYTGGKSYLESQPKKEYSLGGYVSSIPIPNALVNNLFGDISLLTESRGGFDIIGIVIKNEAVSMLSNVYIYFDYPDGCFSKLEFAAVELMEDGDGGYYMEEIASGKALPYYATFYEADGVVNKKLLGNILAGKYVGLWIKRALETDVIDEQRSLDYLEEHYGETLSTEDEISIIFDWD